MPRLSSRRSEASDIEIDGIAEQELARLQQEYRIMEGDRKAYSEESQNIIRKQREAIDVLQKENEELMKDNILAGSQQNQNNDNRNIESLSSMLTVEEDLKGQVSSVKKGIAKLDRQIAEMEKKISLERKNMGGVHMSQAKHVATQKQIRVLENRLDQANKKFNQGLAENSKLREEIDHMRTERTIFQGLYKKLEKRLSDNKEEIAKVTEASTQAYDARDDAQNKMIALKEKSDKELLQYNMELKELMRVIDHDRKLKEFMNIKTEDRAEMQGLTLQYTNRREDRDKGGEKEDTIQSYETAFEQIKEATEIEDLQLLVGKFIETEDKNFALFNYVNELNNNIEFLQEQIADIESNIKQFKQETIEMDDKRQKILKNMEGQYEGSEQEAQKHTISLEATDKILNQLKQGVESLFGKISFDLSSIADMLGGHSGVTDSNLMQHLGIIEQRTNELIQVQAFMSSKIDEDDEERAEPVEQIGLLGKGPLPVPSTINVLPPGTGEDYDSDFSFQSEDENRPLTQTELRERIVRGINKKEGGKSRAKEREKSPIVGEKFEEKTGNKKMTKKPPMKEK